MPWGRRRGGCGSRGGFRPGPLSRPGPFGGPPRPFGGPPRPFGGPPRPFGGPPGGSGHGPFGGPELLFGGGRGSRGRCPSSRGGGGFPPRGPPSRGGCHVNYFNYGPEEHCGDDDEEPCGGQGQGQGQQGQQDKDQGGQAQQDKEQQGNNKPEPDPNALTVKTVNLLVSANGKAHNTSKYEICSAGKNSKLVVRRGQPFDLEFRFNREYDAQQDDLKLVFEAGDKPNPTKGTLVEFVLSEEDKPNEWGAKILSKQGARLRVTIFTPPDLYVGAWDFSVEVVKQSGDSVDVCTYEHDDPIYIIFNPWCKDDAVYLEDQDMVREYCLNETGRIYNGSAKNITSRPWNYGQFESCSLECALYLLDLGELAWTSRGDPVAVVRKLSALVNSNDDGGVVVGNWGGDYSGGKSPLTWTGSAAILESFWEYKRPVKFGQCWVFSGVSTTVCRALGIPARSVTNYASAHDTDGSVTIDVVYDYYGNIDDYNTDDSIWNFHVWNEAWMSRSDLPSGYGGWQAFDSTPQELSNDVYSCGPVSVQAIKQGEINLPYDGSFVFAEVNADRIYWKPSGRGKMERVSTDINTVGKLISTKLPNSDKRLDLTNTYKPEEGSAEERAAVLKANQKGSNRHDIYDTQKQDVTFSIKQDAENSWVGEDFHVFLCMRNTSGEERTVSGRLAVSTMYYTGVVATGLTSEQFTDVVIKPGQEYEQKVTVKSQTYQDKLEDCCMLDVSVWAVVKETNQNYTNKDDFRLRKPHLTIKAPDVIEASKEFQAEVTFTNPLDCPMTKCSVTIDGLNRSLDFPQGNVGPKKTFTATLPITPKKLGQNELIVSFNSAQLEDINGSHPIFIQGKV